MSKQSFEEQYHHLSEDVEPVEEYCCGGYMPVQLGDVFKSSQYTVVQKLGDGSYSTVWLAQDSQNDRYAALKFVTARTSSSSNELRILNHLATVQMPENSKKPYVALLDSFYHDSPNGTHLCLVFPVMAASVYQITRTFRSHPDWTLREKFTYSTAKTLSRQLLKGIAFLHQNGVIHTDLQAGNMMFSIQDEKLALLDFKEATFSKPVQRLDGKDLQGMAPSSLVFAQPLVHLVQLDSPFVIQISDFGGATLAAESFSHKIVTPAGLQAPEVFFGSSWSYGVDIWSFGCMVFQFVTGTALFPVADVGLTREEIKSEYLLALNSIIGPLPDEMLAQWPQYSSFFNADGTKKPSAGGMIGSLPLEQTFRRYASRDFPMEDVDVFLSFIRAAVKVNQEERVTAEALLQHPWLQEVQISSES